MMFSFHLFPVQLAAAATLCYRQAQLYRVSVRIRLHVLRSNRRPLDMHGYVK